jgi:hypothetical protein
MNSAAFSNFDTLNGVTENVMLGQLAQLVLLGLLKTHLCIPPWCQIWTFNLVYIHDWSSC